MLSSNFRCVEIISPQALSLTQGDVATNTNSRKYNYSNFLNSKMYFTGHVKIFNFDMLIEYDKLL